MSKTAPANTEMKDYWQGDAGTSWVAQQERLDAQLATFGEAVLGRAQLAEGERVLDVGCGCGATTLRAANQVGPGGAVAAIDLSGPMLEQASRRIDSAGSGDRFEAIHDDAQTHAFASGVFDAVVSRFGVMFFDDPLAAFRNLAGATRAEGRLVFACWQAREKNPWMFVPAQAALRYLEAPPKPEPDAPGPFSLADAARVRSLLTAAGYRGVEVEPLEDPIRMADPDTAADLMIEIGPLAGMVREQKPAPELLAKVRGAVRDALMAFDHGGTLLAPAAAWIVFARRG